MATSRVFYPEGQDENRRFFIFIVFVSAAAVAALSQKPCRCHSRHLPEQAAEVVRIFKSKQIGDFSHAEPFHQETFGLVDDEGMDIADGGAASSLANPIAKIAGRISQF